MTLMEIKPLPEDLAQWPADPYELLGVPRGVQPRPLRVAYTQRIRAFKPELYPEHFRRLREAYELLLSLTPLADSSVTYRFTAPPSVETPPLQSIARPAPAKSPAEQELQALCDEAWAWAAAGETQRAYERLRELRERHTGHAGIALRLYWLSTLAPEVDPDGSPRAWLLRAMAVADGPTPWRELYRRELLENPWEASSDQCRRLLETETRCGVLFDLVRLRWQGASRLPEIGRIIDEDLTLLRERFRFETESWLRLLIAAIEQLAWSDNLAARDLLRSCHVEIERSGNALQRLAGELDKLDFLYELADAWRLFRRQTHAPLWLVQLIPISWNHPVEEYQSLLACILGNATADPSSALRSLDLALTCGSAILAQLSTVLLTARRMLPPPPEPRSAETLRAITDDFLDYETDWRSYLSFRDDLLHFCIEENIAPELVAEVMLQRSAGRSFSVQGRLAATIARDWPLRLVCLANRLCWASAS